MSIQGMRNTDNFATGERPKNWREGILRLEPNGMAPLAALTSMLKSKSTDDPEFNWFEKVMASQRFSLTTTIDDSETVLVFSGDDPPTESGGVPGPQGQLKTGHVLRSEETGELVRVAADPSTTSVTVTREFAGSTGAAITVGGAGVNPHFVVVGSAYAEGSLAPTGINYDVIKRYNYTQIFRNTLKATRTARKTRLRTGDAIREAKREALQLHMNEMERALWWGNADEDLTGADPLRATGGILGLDPAGAAWIPAANRRTTTQDGPAAGQVTVAVLEEWLELSFRYGSNEKLAFVGNGALLAINQAIRLGTNVNLNISSGQKEFGMAVTRLTSPFGELVLKSHPLFNLQTGGSTAGTAYYSATNYMVVLDMAQLRWRPFDDTMFEGDIQTPGEDAFRAGYLTEAGLEFGHGRAHNFFSEIAVGVAG